MLVRYRAVQNPKPTAIIMHCIDPRFSEAFENFIEGELGLKRFRDIVKKIAGGPAPLAYPTEMPNRCKWLKKHLTFLCEKFDSIEKFVAIAHKNCAYYHTVPHNCCDAEVEKRDLPLVGSFLEMTFPGKKIELYHAKLIEKDTHIIFEQVALNSKIAVPRRLTNSSIT